MARSFGFLYGYGFLIQGWSCSIGCRLLLLHPFLASGGLVLSVCSQRGEISLPINVYSWFQDLLGSIWTFVLK